MTIRKAETVDISRIMEIYEIARGFMRENGNKNQWINGYPAKEMIENDIQQGNLYVIFDEKGIHGVFALIFGEDATYAYIENGKWPNDNPYGTIHRIGTDGTIHGAVAMAKEYALKQVDTIRIDTHADNQVMQHTVKKNGFVECGIIYVEDGSPRIAFQYN